MRLVTRYAWSLFGSLYHWLEDLLHHLGGVKRSCDKSSDFLGERLPKSSNAVGLPRRIPIIARGE
ncbi:hypothetical protein LINPERPRIM_LOCUS19027 [Linum perenne]